MMVTREVMLHRRNFNRVTPHAAGGHSVLAFLGAWPAGSPTHGAQ